MVGLFTSHAGERKPALTHVILVTTDDSGHTCDWGTLGLMVIHVCNWSYTFILGLYSEMVAWRLTVCPCRQMSGQ
jgi:hypothetical protein